LPNGARRAIWLPSLWQVAHAGRGNRHPDALQEAMERTCGICLVIPGSVDMTIGTILLLILILLLIGMLPSWPYSRQWGFAPSGGLGVVVLVVVVLVFMGRI
jgi:hypothetical protein